jgi:diacylglycerol kinase (ATP)
LERITKRRAQSLLESFNFAFEGIIHVLRTQRNMRIHFLAAVIVLVTAVAIGVTKLELIALLLAIAFVFIAEMINSALEQAIDVATTSFDPLAKLAKDIAAGAVLIATVNAVAIGYLVFSGQVADLVARGDDVQKTLVSVLGPGPTRRVGVADPGDEAFAPEDRLDVAGAAAIGK